MGCSGSKWVRLVPLEERIGENPRGPGVSPQGTLPTTHHPYSAVPLFKKNGVDRFFDPGVDWALLVYFYVVCFDQSDRWVRP
jgi:hypothetical protein